MCGIFGIAVSNKSRYGNQEIKKLLARLALLSEARGKESGGLAFRNPVKNNIKVLRAPVPVSELIRSSIYRETLAEWLDDFSGSNLSASFAVIGHSRLVTNGTQMEDHNNQPVIKDGFVAVHNGIIVNADEIWKKYPALERRYEIDTEVMLSLMMSNLNENCCLKASVKNTFNEIYGTVSTGLISEVEPVLLLATNNGSLYTVSDGKGILVFASEFSILREAVNSIPVGNLNNSCIKHLTPYNCIEVNLESFGLTEYHLENPDAGVQHSFEKKTPLDVKIVKNSLSGKNKLRHSLVDINRIMLDPVSSSERKLLEHNYEAVSKLKRCSKCLLPETFPFISFNTEGTCNYCVNYRKKNQKKPIEELHKLVEPYKKVNGAPDCIIPYSGGRDSTYVLHFAKKELGLNPIAFTYDWGMVTDLARRNIARVCGKLGVENIIVSADIRVKRENIRKNILAWLKNPDLGMIPLFMAGDKYFFYYCNQVKKQTGIKLNIWGINPLENTDFKTGFAGLKPKFDKKRIYSLTLLSQMKLFSFVGTNLIKSPSYINSSLIDTFGSFLVRYFFPKGDYYHLYDYLQWDEKNIEKTILGQYDWEKAVDTDSTWRIGDGTAGFYNYIYYTIAGFSENDTFRSNQIREGLISREEALKRVNEENIPRYETIKWYLEIVGLDFESTINRINRIPKIYRTL